MFYLFALIVLTTGCWLTASLLWGSLSLDELIVLMIVNWLLASALVLAARKLSARVWIFAGLLILAILTIPTSVLANIFPARLSQPFGTPIALTFFLIPSMALVITAVLLYSGLNIYKERQIGGAVEGGDSQTRQKNAGRAAVAVLVLSALILAKALHNLYWLMVWDNTYDPLNYMWLIFPVLAVFFSGFMLVFTLPGRTKLAGFLYMLLIPTLITISTLAQRVDFRQLTEERAGRTSKVIDTYYAGEGSYPQDLRQLIPWYTFSLPGPVIIYGQGWCYDGGEDYYRLGYVYRQHWSDPRLTGKIYKSKGEVPDLHRMCEEEIAGLQTQYPDYPYSYWVDGE